MIVINGHWKWRLGEDFSLVRRKATCRDISVEDDPLCLMESLGMRAVVPVGRLSTPYVPSQKTEYMRIVLMRDCFKILYLRRIYIILLCCCCEETNATNGAKR
jgi:hypothetical protein